VGGGYDTADELTNSLQANASSTYGPPNYWIRYFQPSPHATKISAHPIEECDAIWDSGAKNLSPVSEPEQANLTMGSAQGHADAQMFVNAMVNLWTNVGPLKFPTNNILYSFLGQEGNTNLNSDYWSGWANYVNSFILNGKAPFYACLYCTPGSGNCCNVINNASASAKCYIVWTPVHQRCSGTLRNPPAWAAISCSGVPTHLWQFAIENCPLSVHVDMDLSDIDFAVNCFYLSSRP
jgi:hypothetical protein